jgi:DNA topoisomerase-3
MPTVLMVAEKPSICNSIAGVLSHGSSKFEKKGSIPVHRFAGEFQGRAASVIVTSVTGHVFSTDFGPECQSWDVPPVRLFRAAVKKKIESKGVAHTLANLAAGADYLVLWLDCDREGENICFEVISCTAGRMNKQAGGRQQIFRAKFSAVTPPDIERAMRTLGSPNENEALSVDARQELDLKLGVAFSRFQTRWVVWWVWAQQRWAAEAAPAEQWGRARDWQVAEGWVGAAVNVGAGEMAAVALS